MTPKTTEILNRVEKFFLTGVPRKKAYVTLIAQYRTENLRAAAVEINDLMPDNIEPNIAAAIIICEAYGRSDAYKQTSFKDDFMATL